MNCSKLLSATFAAVLPMASALSSVASPALATSRSTPAASAAAPGPTLVARYTFDESIATGRVLEKSGRGSAATIRSADHGVLSFNSLKTGHFIGFPSKCQDGAPVCPRAILEAPNDADLNPGTRRFRWGASIRVLTSQLTDSSNVVQKGLDNTESQWKMQIGPNHGKVQCVVAGLGSTQSYVVRSQISVADGKWHRAQCERNGTSLAIAVDGVVSGRVAVPADLSVSNTRPLRIGGPNLSNVGDLYHGWLDEVFATLG